MTDPTASLDEYLLAVSAKADAAEATATAARDEVARLSEVLRSQILDLVNRVSELEAVPPVTPPPTDPKPPASVGGTFRRPFADTSPFNTTAPAPGPVTDPRTVKIRSAVAAGGAFGINITTYSLPNYEATTTDPLVTVVDVAHGNLTVQMRVPAGAVPAAGTDSNMAILQPDGTLYDLWQAKWVSASRIDTQRLGRCRIDGTGCGPAARAATGQLVPAGIRAAGCSWLGGMIRRHELDAGVIPHALALALPKNWMRYDPPPMYGNGSGEHLYGERGETTGPVGYGNYKGYVPPATEQDHDSAWGAYAGPIPMGTRFVLPKSVDVASLGLNRWVAMMAKAAQDYGVLVVDGTDTSGKWAMFYAEPAAASSPFAAEWWKDSSLDKFRRALVAV